MHFEDLINSHGRDSLIDFDALPQSLNYQQQAFTLRYIHSFCDIPQPSEHLQAIGRTNLDLFNSELEGIAFNNQQHKEIDDCSNDDGSTSINSQVVPASSNSVNTTPKKSGCSCKKTGCLKMYCECFSNGQKCGPECGCVNCMNDCKNEEAVEKARQIAKHRFKQAYYNPVDGGIKKRCTCKKTQCQKKYCQCFNMGVPCNQLCKCEGCQNGKHDHSHHHSKLQQALIC